MHPPHMATSYMESGSSNLVPFTMMVMVDTSTGRSEDGLIEMEGKCVSVNEEPKQTKEQLGSI